MKNENDYIDIFKAVGKQEYVIYNIPHAVILNKFPKQQYHLDQKNLRLEPYQSRFTTRELDVVRLLIKGFTSRKISEILGISYETARTHRKNILNKANTNNTDQLINYVL